MVVTILEMSKNLRKLVILLGLGPWVDPQRRLVVCVEGGVGLDGRAGKFSFLGVGDLMIALESGVRKVWGKDLFLGF